MLAAVARGRCKSVVVSPFMCGLVSQSRRWTSGTGLRLDSSQVNGELKLFNSLSGAKETVTCDGGVDGRTLTWYSCGPTVYDKAHVGHGVCYVQQDISIRILREKFGFNVMHVMNITDVDDKIIQRCKELRSEAGAIADETVDQEEANSQPNARKEKGDGGAHSNLAKSARIQAFEECEVGEKMTIGDLTRLQEQSFWRDMAALDVRMPTVVTRVSEYMGTISSFINTLLVRSPFLGRHSGVSDSPETFAYQALDGSGSVYFDRQLYKRVFGQFPSLGTAGKAGDLDEAAKDSGSHPGKRHSHDFALWKAHSHESAAYRKELLEMGAEWELDVGGGDTVRGRPGWHIECSAMCNHVFGDILDVHAGGCDLIFPHHTNEIAQIQALAAVQRQEKAEAATGGEERQADHELLPWPRIFYHVGHLHIQGRKMSKSLKNFVSIQEFLERHSALHLRLFCLLHHYRDHVDFGDEQIEEARSIAKKFTHFFTTLEIELADRRSRGLAETLRWSTADGELHSYLQEARREMRAALADDLDTPRMTRRLVAMCKMVSDRVTEGGGGDSDVSTTLLVDVYDTVRSMLSMVGVDTLALCKLPRTIPLAGPVDAKGEAGSSLGSKCGPEAILEELLRFRTSVREEALAAVRKAKGEDKAAVVRTLERCDEVRDRLGDMKIEVKDFAKGVTTWNWK